jgi:hypothetical protein
MFPIRRPDDDLAATCLCPSPAFEKAATALKKIIMKKIRNLI